LTLDDAKPAAADGYGAGLAGLMDKLLPTQMAAKASQVDKDKSQKKTWPEKASSEQRRRKPSGS
jgi:hypothetical protein